MEMDRKKAIIIAIILLTSTTLAVGAQNGWFNFIYDPMGLDIDDTYMEDDFELKDLPLWFSSDVLVIGSGFSYQEHTVSVSIYHDRPSNGAPWYADGSYSLNLKLLGTIIEPITSGSFTDLSTSNPFTTLYQWTPASPPNNYTIALNITDVTWIEMTTYTITASAGTGGSIDPSGAIPVLEGAIQSFTITADTGYVISDVIVDSVSEGAIEVYSFIDVQADHTIEAYFVPSFITMRSYQLDDTTPAYEFVDDPFGFTYQELLFNGAQTMQYIAGVETVNSSLRVMFTNSPITSITYSLEYMYLNGTSPVTVFDDTISCSLNTFDMYTFINLFTAPSIPNEDYSIRVHIKSVTTAP